MIYVLFIEVYDKMKIMKKKFLIMCISFTMISCGGPDPSTYPYNNASYEYTEQDVGCKSGDSEQKKDDKFESNYRNHWMTWSGEVMLPESDNVSLNVDRFGIQDLQVDFADSNAGYNLREGETITVRFVMKYLGGCFLPYSGAHAKIVR